MRPQNPATEQPTDIPHFAVRLSGTARGARLARRLAAQQFTEWTGLPNDCDTTYAVALVADELATNAVTHGSLPGRDFRLTLLLPAEPAVVRIEVTDTRPERLPRRPIAEPGSADAMSGRGLLLVSVYATRWGCEVRDAFTKTVWAEVSRPS
ncbi:ATP-binding protein [Streptomyces sp. TRM43335]|uniref:ATP-binding protein n=1 Tax=Streptomyces taklimakanensis TaxID=2569853 RepID=A0A6G2BGV8_9ACTN|nr:ATP-binding protein [Streptomyces taklimakanensis]MTE21498.1 ATP-binding protein [Streptomyces taklimakanensis]